MGACNATSCGEERATRRARVGLLPVALLLASSCGGRTAPQGRPPAPVEVGEVTRKDVPIQVQAVGAVQSISTVSVKPLVSGTLQKVLFEEGQHVEKGELLFRIDPAPYQAALAQAKANLASAAAQARNAHLELARQRNLRKRGMTTAADYTSAVAQARSADAAVEADRAAVKSAELELGYCTIEAPISGRTGNLLVTAGNVVSPTGTTALVVIQQIQPIYVAFSVPEAYVSTLRRPEVPLQVTASPPGSQQVHRGKVTFVDNTVDAQTGTIRVKATMANEDEGLWPGQFVRVTLDLGVRHDALVVPLQAVQHGQQGTYVFVMEKNDTVRSVPVEVLQSNQEEAVIGKGLTAGEKVITVGQLRLVPGAKVEVVQTPEALPTKVGQPSS